MNTFYKGENPNIQKELNDSNIQELQTSNGLMRKVVTEESCG